MRAVFKTLLWLGVGAALARLLAGPRNQAEKSGSSSNPLAWDSTAIWHTDRAHPSLVDARARVRRASEHIARLRREPMAVSRGGIHSNQSVVGAGPGVAVEDSTHTDSIAAGESLVVPPIASVLIGETIYNLRGALDYLVYELSILDSGEIKKRTQFPIESSPDNWTQRLGDYLRGLSKPHQAAIKALQPFDGCAWTALIRDLSNSDKHRRLIATSGRASKAMTLSRLRLSATGEVSVTVDTDLSTVDDALGIEGASQFTALSFDSPTSGQRFPVTETLDLLARQVADVIETFEPDFRPRPAVR